MRHIFIDKKGISNVLGYLFSFAIASLVMISAVLLTTSIIDDRTAKVGNMEAQSIANKIADGIIEAVAVGESTSDMDYNKVLDIPTDIAGRNYYVEITDRAVYVNTTDGLVSKSCPTYGAESSKIGLLHGRFYGGSGKINITLNKPDVAYRFDFGTGNITSHSPVESGYYMVTNSSSTDSTRCDPPWWNAEYKARVPILVNNDSPENLVDVPVKVVLSSSSFDYSLANVTVDSSSEVASNLMFVDPSRQIFAKINIITSTWDPSWFYTYCYDPNPTLSPVEVKISEISGGYNASYIDGDTIKLKAKGETLETSWDSNTGTVKFNATKALEILETGGAHFLSSPTYTVSVYGLLKNGLEFSGSGTISIKGAIYVSPTGDNVIGAAINGAAPGSTIFVREGTTYREHIDSSAFVTNNHINLIGEGIDKTIIKSSLGSGDIIHLSSVSYFNIDSLTISDAQTNMGGDFGSGIKAEGCSHLNITNCKVTRCKNGIWVRSSSHDVGISNCITCGNDRYRDGDGINIGGSEGPTYKVRITNCYSYSNWNENGDGFDITDCHDIILLNCKSYGNVAVNANGILIQDSYNCIIKDSLIHSNNGKYADGIRITTIKPDTTGSYSNQIINCTIFNQDSSFDNNAGIYIQDGPTALHNPCNTIKNCKIYNNWVGIAFTAFASGNSRNNYIEGCNVYNNSYIGIKINDENGLGLSSYNYIRDCNVYSNGHEYSYDWGKGGCGIFLFGSKNNEIRGCNVFDNGNDGLRLDGGGLIYSSDNIIENNNFYCNGRMNSSGTGIYCGANPANIVGSNGNEIHSNNFGYDYAYNKKCVEYNFKYAQDECKSWWGNPNDWTGNFWDNYENSDGSGRYYIPNTEMDNTFLNYDGNPTSTTRYANPDYIIVTPTPQVTPVNLTGGAKTYDSCVSEVLVEQGINFGDLDKMWVDPCYQALSRINRMFIKFDLSDIPPVQNVISAKLKIYYSDWWHSGNNPQARTHQCFRVLDPWSEYRINWINQPSYYSTETDHLTLGSPGVYKIWNVTSDVVNFLSGAQINHGWVIKDSDEGYLGHWVEYYSAKYDSKEKVGNTKPILQIVYTPASNDPGPHYHPRTIAKGIENVIAGGTVYVKENFTAGKLNPYPEKFTISKELKLIGEDRDNVIIDDKKSGGNIISVSSQKVSIDSLTIRNGTSAGINIVPSTAPDITKPINITNCKINNTQNGIFLVYSYVNIKNCKIYSNSANGIYISSNTNDRGDFNHILNCNIHDNTNYGILLGPSGSSGYCDSNTIANCSVYGNDGAINMYKGRKNSIENCNFYDNNYGIWLANSGSASSNTNKIAYCDVNNNNNGIYLTSSHYNTIKGCDIYQNTQDGIRIDSSNDNEITKCNIHDNANYGIKITSSSSNINKIYKNKFINNNGTGPNPNAYDDGSSYKWDNNYPTSSNPDGGGNLWSNYDEESENASDYYKGARTDGNRQPDSGSDGIADLPCKISGGNNQDKYPWCRKPVEMPYYIDYWNPYGESVILVNMSLANHTSKYIYLYYGAKSSATKHSIAEVSVFSDDFNGSILDANKWQGSGNINGGILTIHNDDSIITKDYSIPEMGEPGEVLNAQTINQSMYIVEAMMKVNNSDGYMFLFGPLPYIVEVNTEYSSSSYFIIRCHNGDTEPQVELHDLSHWIRLKSYIYRTYEKYKTNQAYTNESKHINIAGFIYNFDSYADEGNVSHPFSRWKIGPGGSWQPPLVMPTSGKIGIACGYLISNPSNPILVDWIRVMKTPVIPPTITIGPVESVNYGWDNPAVIHSKNIVLPRQQPSDDPFYPGPVLCDFNYGNIAGVFDISNLPQDEYTITVTMGNATGACKSTTVEFFKDRIDTTPYGKLTIPATEAGKFETKSLLIIWYGGNLLAKFSSPTGTGDWTVNSMIIERGKKGIHVGLE